jgi:hypothetical protein
MFDFFRGLFRRHRSNILTDEQIRWLAKHNPAALAHELNRPLWESGPEFVSSRQFKSTDVPSRLRRIKWFCNCGEPLTVKLTAPVRQVPNWQRAIESSRSTDWENAKLEAYNQLTGWLAENVPREFKNWNKLVKKFKATVIHPVVEPQVLAVFRLQKIDERIVTSVTYTTLGAVMENAYLHTGHKAFFFLELLEIYEAGHFPCGWRGEWPAGQLLVF